MIPIMKRSYLIAITICALIFSQILPAQAASETDQAKHYIQQLGDKVLVVIKNGSNDRTTEEKLTKIFDQEIDTAWIGKFVLGRYNRTITPQQKTEFLKLYRKFLLDAYVPKFKEYTGETFKITGAQAGQRGDYLVQTKIFRPQGEPVLVDYRLKPAGGSFKVIDIIAEGVSTLNTHRSEFGSIIASEGMDALNKKLVNKVIVKTK